MSKELWKKLAFTKAGITAKEVVEVCKHFHAANAIGFRVIVDSDLIRDSNTLAPSSGDCVWKHHL